jgi:tetratricopeptide (TPR) repeat protein
LVIALIATLSGACSDAATRRQRFLESGDRFLTENKLSEAIIQYRNAVQAEATSGEARKKLADAYSKAGDHAHALEEFVRAADLLPTDAGVQLSAGAYLLLARKWEDSLARADAALKLRPDSVPAHVLRGNALAGLTSFDEALKAIEEAIRLNPSQGDTFTNLGLVQLARGHQEEAESAFKKAVELSPQSVETRLALGNFYWSVGRPKDTEAAFLSALQLQPENGPANRAMAALTIATGRSREAEPYLRRLADSSSDPTAVFALAEYYLAAGRAKDAVARLEAMSPALKETPGAGQRLARAYAAAGDMSKASSLVDQVLARDAKAVDAQLLKGELLLREGKRDESLAVMRAAATANPSSAEAQFALGRIYAARGDAVAAEAAFKQVLSINPRASAAQVELARLQLAAGRIQDSVRTAEEATKEQPGNLIARLALLRSLIASKDFARAEREVTTLLREQPNLADVHVLAGLLAIQKNNVADARRAFERGLELNPNSLDALSGLIAADLRANDIPAAKARIESRLSSKPTPGVLMLAARTYWALKEQAAAERTLRAAIEADPTSLQPYGMLGQIYMSQNKLDQARAEFEALAARQARPVGPLTMVAMIHQAQGNSSAAKKRYEEVLALDDRATVAANNLAWMHAEEGGDLELALKLAQTATSTAPDVPELMDTLGWVYYKKGQAQLAIPVFERCVEKAPTSALYRYHLGLALLKLGDTAKGRAALQRALELNPDQPTTSEIRRLLSAS